MKSFTHLSLGLLLGVFLWNNDPLIIFAVVFGSLFPDVDYPFSLIGRLSQPLSFWIHEEFGHRTITHSLTYVLINSLFGLILKNFYFQYISLGILSHLLLDLLTNQGVMLLWPLQTRFILLDGELVTGSKTDYFLGIIFFITFISSYLLNLI